MCICGIKKAEMNCLFLSCILLLTEKSVCTSDKQNNLFNFSARLQGKDVNLSQFAGKVVLVVNVASECGYTDSHYKALVKLQSDLEPTGKFTVLAFPCNQFGKQEPGDDEEIRAFAENNYNVNFPVFSKVNVIDNDVPAMWSYLINNTEAPTWNFYKYLVDTKGHVVSVWGPWISVEDITQDILDLINGNYHQKEKSRSRNDEL